MPRHINFDMDALRSFATGMELGSFARAADRLGRSTSAVSAQLKKLEDQAGTPLLRKAGRGMALTDAGERLLAYARRLLELNDEAALALRGIALSGTVRLGLQEDFSDSVLTAVLGQFARSHPHVHVEAVVARNADLLDGVGAGRLDLALAWRTDVGEAEVIDLGSHPVHWIARQDSGGLRDADGVLPLVVFEAPCALRTMSTAALDAAGIRWRIAFTSASLGGVWAATAAGLGVAVRAPWRLPAGLRTLDPGGHGLPALGDIGLGLYFAPGPRAPLVARLAETLCRHVETIGANR